MFTDLLVGGLSGAISRTATAPLELYKIQRQNAFMPDSSIRAVLRKEGVRYLWKGNGANCMRVFPQTGINYAVFEFSTQNILYPVENEELRNLMAGALGGSTSMICTYPLETIRSRLCLQTNNSHYEGLFHAFRKIPPSHLYQGLRMSLIGFAPFTAISFCAYFNYKKKLERLTDWNADLVKMIGGGLAGSTAISMTYPTDLIRRRLQLQGFDKSVPQYSGILDCLLKIVRKEGVRGLYRGLYASYVKLFPTVGIQFWAMEKCNEVFKS